MTAFSGIWIPLITPFANGQVDLEALRALVVAGKTAGVSGFVALGTTGEPSALDQDEHHAVLSTILDAAVATPVIVGLAGNNAMDLQARVAELNRLPIAGLLVPAPYYVRPSQQGLLDHFTSLADHSAHPLVLYDIPYRTGVKIDLSTLRSLAAHPNIVAIKDCAGSIETTLALIRDGRLAVLAGNDIEFFNTLCLGGHGAIAASAHVCTREFVATWQAVRAGDLHGAREHYHRLVPLIQALGSEPNPAPVKAALSILGAADAALRAPMTRASDPLMNHLTELLAPVNADARGVSP